MISSSYILLGILLISKINYSIQQCNQIPGLFFSGNDLPNGQFFVNSVGECCLRCVASTSCQAYSVLISSGRYSCYLKYAIGSNLVSNTLASSGVKQQSSPTFVPPILPSSTMMTTAATTTASTTASTTTTTTAATTTRSAICILIADTNYPSNDIPNQGFGNVASSQDCCNLCGANPSCTAFTYSVNDKYCWLKNPTLNNGLYTGQSDIYLTFVSGSLISRTRK